MNEKDYHVNEENTMAGNIEDLLQLIWALLSSPSLPCDKKVMERYQSYGDFQKIVQFMLDLRELSFALNKGDLNKFVYSKGYILSNLKALQSNLRHLTWQTKMIAEGDFSQRVDFLGDFSDSFNEMTDKLKEYSDELKRLANIDSLTQIPNRFFLEQFLTETFKKHLLNNDPFSIMMMDIDFFKRVNDTYGHIVGDKTLVKVSEILSAQFRSTDIFGRYGGEEFLAVLPCVNIEDAYRTASRVLKVMDETPIYIESGMVLNITISIGISEFRPEDSSYVDIINRSDTALYLAKKGGRNQAVAV